MLLSNLVHRNLLICEELTQWHLSPLSREQYQRQASFSEGECVIKFWEQLA